MRLQRESREPSLPSETWPALLVGFLVGFLFGRHRLFKRDAKYGVQPTHATCVYTTPPGTPGRAADHADGQLLVRGHRGDDVKLVLVVRRDLKMGTGKVAAQCGHATLGAYRSCNNRALLAAWERAGQPKIALKCKTLSEMLALEREARRVGISTHLVLDAGKTQIAAGSATVLALGPAESARIDRITGRLKLL